MRTLAALAVTAIMATTATAQNSPIQLVQKLDMRTWSVSKVWLARPVVTKTPHTLELMNPAFNQSSYIELTTQRFAIVSKTGNEPRARLRVLSTMRATLAGSPADSVWIAVHDVATGARLGVTSYLSSDERTATLVKISQQRPPIMLVHVRYTVRLAPRQSWKIFDLKANRTFGASVVYRAGAGVVSVRIDASSWGKKLGVIWSPAASRTHLPLRGWRGAGLGVVAPVVFLPIPLQPIVTRNAALIRAIRAGYWQALGGFPAPDIGWRVGG